jgi:MFS family permease
MMAAGVGSMLAALLVPTLLEKLATRTIMLCGGGMLSLALFSGLLMPGYTGLFPIWLVIGFASSLVLIPTGLVLRNSCREQDRNDYFSANFALSHGMWFIGYLLAGWAGSHLSMPWAFVCMALLALLATLLAWQIWPANDESEMWHEHVAEDHLHPHVHDEHHQHEHKGWEGPEPHAHPHYHPRQHHRHRFVIDEHHAHWPKQ